MSRWPFVCMGQTPHAWRPCEEYLLSLAIGRLCEASVWEYHGKSLHPLKDKSLGLLTVHIYYVYRFRGKRKPEMATPQVSEALLGTKNHRYTQRCSCLLCHERGAGTL